MSRYIKERFAKIFPNKNNFPNTSSYLKEPILYWLWSNNSDNIWHLLCRLHSGSYAYVEISETGSAVSLAENLEDVVNGLSDSVYNMYLKQSHPILSSFMAFPCT